MHQAFAGGRLRGLGGGVPLGNHFGEPQHGEQGDGGWSEWGFALHNAGAGPRGPSIDEYSRAESTDINSVIKALVEAQSTAQIALANTQHTNLIALHTATTQALATKGGDKDSKLMAAKRRILQACARIMHVEEFEVEQVFRDMDAEGGTADALGRILWKRLQPIPLSPHKTNIHISPQMVATVKSFNLSFNGNKT
jgi:hypothetical protein